MERLVEQALRTPQIPTHKLYLNVPARHVQPIYSPLEHRGFPVVITAGWAADGIAERAIRVYSDLDLLVPIRSLPAARHYLVDAATFQSRWRRETGTSTWTMSTA